MWPVFGATRRGLPFASTRGWFVGAGCCAPAASAAQQSAEVRKVARIDGQYLTLATYGAGPSNRISMARHAHTTDSATFGDDARLDRAPWRRPLRRLASPDAGDVPGGSNHRRRADVRGLLRLLPRARRAGRRNRTGPHTLDPRRGRREGGHDQAPRSERT